MPTFANRIATVETPLVADALPTTPAIWWFNGNKPARTPGRFYVKHAALQQEPLEPWVPSQRFAHEPGFETETLHLALITWRQQPYRTLDTAAGGEQRKTRQYLAAWEPGAQIHTEIVCLAEGIAEPVVWSFHGMTGRAVMGKSGLLATYRSGLLRAAEQVAGKRLPLWTFWLPLSTQIDTRGQVVYTDTGHGSLVTLPMLHLPTEADTTLMNDLFVGENWLAYGYAVYADFEAWRHQRRGQAQAATSPGADPVDVPFAPDDFVR